MKAPLRPHESEIHIYENVINHLAENTSKSRFCALLLGVTPEIVHMSWPGHAELTAVDRSDTMISEFWPGDIPGRRRVIQADWFEMPFEDASFDLIIGDGVFNFMSFPEGFEMLASTLCPLLDASGKLCVRVFNQLSKKENPIDLIKEFNNTENLDYFEFRYRLATSLQKEVEDGVYITKEILDRYLLDHGIKLDELYRKSGYIPPKLPPIKSKKVAGETVTYPTKAEFVSSLKDIFQVEETYYGKHALSHRTPIVLCELQVK